MTRLNWHRPHHEPEPARIDVSKDYVRPPRNTESVREYPISYESQNDWQLMSNDVEARLRSIDARITALSGVCAKGYRGAFAERLAALQEEKRASEELQKALLRVCQEFRVGAG